MTPDLLTYRDAELDLDALVTTARRLLRLARLRVEDGRVADAVDARGVRYYQTLGVIDRPLRYEGRRAVYGYRHLLQLLAVRRLQREGYPLAVIQATLPATSTADLEASLSHLFLESVPERDLAPIDGGAPATGAVSPQLPALSARPELNPAPLGAPLGTPLATRRVLTGDLAPGVTLSIDTGQVADADELFARIAQRIARLLQEG